MKKIFFVLVLIIFLGLPALAQHKPNPKDLIMHEHYTFSNIKTSNRQFTCYNSSCYDFNSFHYNHFTKIYSFDMIMDLMWCNYHQEYKSPYNDDYITHLIFKVNFHEPDKINIKCIGYVTGNVVVEYENGKASSAHYDILKEHKNKPTVIKNIESFENTLNAFINTKSLSKMLKTW